jgi:hypothetical protein
MIARLRWFGFVGFGIVAASLAAAGCSSDDVAVYPVRGTVTFEGRPLPGGGAIDFIPLTRQEGKTAGGTIAADGTYRLSTYNDGDGSMVGEFRVVITQVTDQEPPNTEDGEAPATAPPGLPAADRIPTIYSDPQNSPLTAKVEAKSENVFDFPLTRNVPK